MQRNRSASGKVPPNNSAKGGASTNAAVSPEVRYSEGAGFSENSDGVAGSVKTRLQKAAAGPRRKSAPLRAPHCAFAHSGRRGAAGSMRERNRRVDTFMFMSERVQQEEECELKALECERIAAGLATKDEPFHRIHLDLAAKWREKAAGIAAARRRRGQSPV
jgi:hypothetical protein